jgi:hypothetical protein
VQAKKSEGELISEKRSSFSDKMKGFSEGDGLLGGSLRIASRKETVKRSDEAQE